MPVSFDLASLFLPGQGASDQRAEGQASLGDISPKAWVYLPLYILAFF